jgi:hypothetical protein
VPGSAESSWAAACGRWVIGDFILADALLGIECKGNTGYEFYYGEQHIERLKETGSEDKAGFGDNLEPSFGEEITYLENMIKMIDNNTKFF